MTRLRHFALSGIILATAAFAAASEPSKVVMDTAHGGYPPPAQLKQIEQALGFTFVTNTGVISAPTLAGAKLLYLRAPVMPIGAEEKNAIIEFVRKGGSLCVVCDEEERTSLTRTGVNDILQPFGLQYTADTPYLHNQGALAKAGVVNKADRELPFSGGRAVHGGTPFAWQLDREGRPSEPFAAYHQLENGARLVVMSEGMASLFLGTAEGERLSGVPRDFTRTTYWGKDSAIFMQEVFAWLLEERW